MHCNLFDNHDDLINTQMKNCVCILGCIRAEWRISYNMTASRGSLKRETFKLLECLKSWFRLGIFTRKVLYAIVGDMEEETMEALGDTSYQ